MRGPVQHEAVQYPSAVLTFTAEDFDEMGFVTEDAVAKCGSDEAFHRNAIRLMCNRLYLDGGGQGECWRRFAINVER